MNWPPVYEKSYIDVMRSYFDLLTTDGPNSRADTALSPSYRYASDNLSENFKTLTEPNTFFVVEDARGVFHLRQTECQECKNALRFGRGDSRSSGFLFERHRSATQWKINTILVMSYAKILMPMVKIGTYSKLPNHFAKV